MSLRIGPQIKSNQIHVTLPPPPALGGRVYALHPVTYRQSKTNQQKFASNKNGTWDHGGATTTGPDATYHPAICQNSGGGEELGGGVWPGVGGGSGRESGGVLPGVWGGVLPGVEGGSGQGSGGRRMG